MPTGKKLCKSSVFTVVSHTNINYVYIYMVLSTQYRLTAIEIDYHRNYSQNMLEAQTMKLILDCPQWVILLTNFNKITQFNCMISY